MEKSPRKTKLYLVALVLSLSILGVVLTGTFVYEVLRKDVTLKTETDSYAIKTWQRDLKALLIEQKIVLMEGDTLSVPLTSKLKDGMVIELHKAHLVRIDMKSGTVTVRTPGLTVADALTAAEVVLGDLDRVEPSMETALTDDMHVKVIRVVEKSISKVVKMPYRKEVVKSPKLEKGITKTMREGKTGKKTVVTKVIYEDGLEVQRKIAEENVIKAPVTKIVMTGLKTSVDTGRGGLLTFRRAFHAEASAYWAGSCGKPTSSPGYGRTATGRSLKKGIVAVDPRVIPYGTWLYIEGYGIALAADTGGAIHGNEIDLAFDTHHQCMSFGRQTVKVYILNRPAWE